MELEAAIPMIAVLLLCWGFVRVINAPDNPIEFWHFFSSYNERANKEYGDINSLGMVAGVLACVFVIVWTTYKADDMNPWVLGVCLIYLGGVKSFASWLRTVAAKRYTGADAADIPAPVQREVTHTDSDKTITQGQR
jgi:hypothetical protein